jgi:hypothetical protein
MIDPGGNGVGNHFPGACGYSVSCFPDNKMVPAHPPDTISPQYYGPLHCEFPGIHYLDHAGGNATYPRTRLLPFSLPPVPYSLFPIACSLP